MIGAWHVHFRKRIFVFALALREDGVSTATRQDQILGILRHRGYAAIEELAGALAVTPQTVRRDVQDMAAEGLLLRHHGGASLPSSIANTDYALRHIENAAAKAAIARAAAERVPDGSSVFLTLGTTVEAVAAALTAKRALRVVTNSTAAARILGAAPGISVQVLGGTFRPHNGGLTGALTVELAARWRCDLLVTGIGAVSADGMLLDYHEEEVAVARVMMAQARATILVADHSKFLKAASCVLAPLSAVSAVVSDRAPPAAHRKSLRAAKAELVVAER
jgi:DeoR family glycerol-3-phosphate regulon repressor